MRTHPAVRILLILISLSTFLTSPSFLEAASVTVNTVGIKLVHIKPGQFLMGSPDEEAGREWDEKQHKVIIQKAFYMSQTEITQRQWINVMKYNPSLEKDCGGNCPVETVSWNECQEFIKKLNALENTNSYRLPTEAEWEYAARAGSTAAFPYGNDDKKNCEFSVALDRLAWYCGNSGKGDAIIYDLSIHPVSTKRPNPWGLYDMHGNVQEWCLDRCGWRTWTGRTGVITDTYEDNVIDPLSKKGEKCVFRGGGFNSKIERTRCAERGSYRPTAKKNNLGFRIVKE